MIMSWLVSARLMNEEEKEDKKEEERQAKKETRDHE